MANIIRERNNEKPFLHILILYFIILISGCAAPNLVLIDPNEAPDFLDDLDIKSLETAIGGSLSYYDRMKDAGLFLFGDNLYSSQELKKSLNSFIDIIRSSDQADIKQRKIVETFDIYKSAGSDNHGTVLFTGYYEPVLDGSLEQTEKYKYPVYGTPDDLVKVKPESCRGNDNKCRIIIGRWEEGRVVPYYCREEIDSLGKLNGRKLEIVWLSDPIERFYLHIQGSGKIRLPDGSQIRIGYAQSNGHPYRSIGTYLLKGNKLTNNELTHQTIKKYLHNHPDELDDIFNYNERYIFFRVVKEGPVGAIGAIVTPGRSIATDPKLFPKGILAFIKLTKPVFDLNHDITDRQPFSRFVLNQDEGSAIKGPGRVDLFCGTGEDAELFAGSLKEKGELYFLMKKKGID